MTSWWTFFDDIVRQKWGDILAMCLIITGVVMIIANHNEVVQDTGKGLIASGIAILRPASLKAGTNGNGNGHVPDPVPAPPVAPQP